MKTWEIIKELMENPKLTFKNLRFGGIVGYKEDGALAWRGTEKNGEAFTIHCLPGGCIRGNWNDDWELVNQPVDFMTAVNSGKLFKPESWIYSVDDKFRNLYDNLEMFSGRQVVQVEILNGKWFVE